MTESRREKLIAKASWWAGWCIDFGPMGGTDLVKLHTLLLDVKGQMKDDREEDGASMSNWTKTSPEEFLERSAVIRAKHDARVVREERERIIELLKTHSASGQDGVWRAIELLKGDQS